jgi:hypothetical protein
MATLATRRRSGNRSVSVQQQRQEAFQRATSGCWNDNCTYLVMAFSARGIPIEDIHPRENCLTYRAWQQVGRQVMKGEKGVKVTTYIPVERTEKDAATGEEKRFSFSRPWSATVFHISQTKAMGEAEGGAA